MFAASVAVGWGFRDQMRVPPREQTNFAAMLRNYRAIFAHPHARVCYGGVFIEGSCLLGLFPFVAAFLAELGEPRPSIAGLVMAGFPIGGLVYTSSVSRLLPRLGEQGLIIGGGALMASQLAVIAFGPPWPVQLACFRRAGLRLLHDPRLAADVCLRDFDRGAGNRGRDARLLFFPWPDRRADRLRLRHLAHAGKVVDSARGAAVDHAHARVVCARLLQHKPVAQRR